MIDSIFQKQEKISYRTPGYRIFQPIRIPYFTVVFEFWGWTWGLQGQAWSLLHCFVGVVEVVVVAFFCWCCCGRCCCIFFVGVVVFVLLLYFLLMLLCLLLLCLFLHFFVGVVVVFVVAFFCSCCWVLWHFILG